MDNGACRTPCRQQRTGAQRRIRIESMDALARDVFIQDVEIGGFMDPQKLLASDERCVDPAQAFEQARVAQGAFDGG